MDINYEDQHYEEEEDDDANAVAYPDEAEVTIVDRDDVVANLDIDDDEDTLDISNGEFNIGDGLHSSPNVAPTGIQQKYLWSLHNQLRVECICHHHNT